MVQLFGADLYLWAIPAAWLIAYVPVAIRDIMIPLLTGTCNNIQPRSQVAEFEASKKLSTADARFLDRCNGAHDNGLEAFPVFTASILFAMQRSVVPVPTLNFLASLFLGLRVVYNFVYIGGTSTAISGVRSLVWFLSLATCMTIFFKSI